MTGLIWTLLGIGAALTGVAIYDLCQRKHAILRNFPIIGHFRFILEAIGPELRQYIVTDNDSERPFSRDQRRWVYASSKKENNYFGFGTDNDLELTPNYLIIKHAPFPLTTPAPGDSGYDEQHRLPSAKVWGGYRKRAKAFRPDSAVHVSGMSFGSLGSAAVDALNQGCKLAGCMQNTGEAGLSNHHLHGADVILQIGTAYFGCRDENGAFSLQQLLAKLERCPQIRAIEVKLSQGAKPGIGGLLPKGKITPEIAEARGIPMGRDCISPAGHTAFSDADSLLDFVEMLAAETGLPVGLKSAIGQGKFWNDLAKLMAADPNRGVDFIVVDGGEGGTGAGPLVYADHVALPFKIGFTRVYRTFMEHGFNEKVAFIGSGKLGFPADALFAFALGCDQIAVAREAMMAIGCIQAQRCHTGHCPTGVATHNPWLMRGLDPTLKAARLANYIVTLRHELIKLSHTCGVVHPAFVTTDDFELLDGQLGMKTIEEVFSYNGHPAVPSVADAEEIRKLMAR